MLKKIFLGFIALFFVLFGGLFLMMGYVFNNPEKVFSAFTTMTEKFMDGQPYEENAEFLLQGIQRVQLSSRRADLHVKTYTGATLKVVFQGKVPRFEQGPFIIQTVEKEVLNIEFQEPMASHWVQMNVNGREMTQESNSQLVAEIYLPESYKGHVFLDTKNGSVELRLPEHALYELDLVSNSGVITNNLKQKPTSEIQAHEVGHIKIQTSDGSISVEPL